MKSRMPQSSLSIATECWTLERRPATRTGIERERSRSSEGHHAELLVATWYYLIPDPSGTLVSEVVDSKDLAQERAHIPGRHFTLTGPTDGHNHQSDCATMSVYSWLTAATMYIRNIFLLMSVSPLI